MDDLENAIRGLELRGYQEGMPQCDSCPYDGKDCWTRLKRDALSLLKAQEPMTMTVHDLEANHVEKMPVWVEWRESAKGECADYEKADGWAVLNVDEFVDVACFGGRCWTSRPTDEQREATPWPEPPREG